MKESIKTASAEQEILDAKAASKTKCTLVMINPGHGGRDYAITFMKKIEP